MATLGCPDEYEVFIVHSRTERTLARLPWAQVSWQRLRNGISAASVTVAELDGGLQCCAAMGGLFPWVQLLRIERNGTTVWDGPIMGWNRGVIGNRGERGVTIRAKDRFVLTQKRLIARTREVEEPAGDTVWRLLDDARIGDPTVDPYRIDYPTFGGIVYSSSSETPVQADGSVQPFKRDFRAESLQTVFSAVSGLVEDANLFYTVLGPDVLMNEASVRASMGGARDRPVFNERTVVEIPGFNVDGEAMATVAYRGGASQGTAGHSLVRFNSYWADAFVDAVLEIGTSDSQSKNVQDLHKQASIAAARAATPTFTLEQVHVSSEFGGPRFSPDLSNLLPGVWISVDFDDTCAFELAQVDIGWEARYGYDFYDGAPAYVHQLTPYISDRVAAVRLDQMDVSVEVADGTMSEVVNLSCSSAVDWNGRLPTGWPTYLDTLSLT